MLKRIKILHISATSTGGVGYHLLMLARYINKDFFELAFALPSDSHFYYKILKEGVKVYNLKISRNPWTFKNLQAFYKLWKIIKKNDFDIVHTHTSVGGFIGRVIAKIKGIPLVLWSIHGWAFNYPYGSLGRRKFFKIIEKGLDHLTDYYIAVSKNMKQVGIEASITNSKKIKVIHHGIEITNKVHTNLTTAKEEFGIDKNSPVIGTIGRLEPQKSVDDLIKAVSYLKDKYSNIKLILVGDGPLRKNLEELAQELNIKNNIIFTGWKKDVNKYIACMDIFCFSSRWESFGIALLEAMRARKPIIATCVGGIPEIVENEKGGILVPPQSPKYLANAVDYLLFNKKVREKMGNYNKNQIKKKFDIRKVIRKYENFYKEIVKCYGPWYIPTK